jgi:hypothetical protein
LRRARSIVRLRLFVYWNVIWGWHRVADMNVLKVVELRSRVVIVFTRSYFFDSSKCITVWRVVLRLFIHSTQCDTVEIHCSLVDAACCFVL